METAVTKEATVSAVARTDQTRSTSGARAERETPATATQLAASVVATRATETVSPEPIDDPLAATSTPDEPLVVVIPETVDDLSRGQRLERTLRRLPTPARRVGPPHKPPSVGRAEVASETPAPALSGTSAEITTMTPARTVESEVAETATIGDAEIEETGARDAGGASAATDAAIEGTSEAMPAASATIDSSEIVTSPILINTSVALAATQVAQTTKTQHSLDSLARSMFAAGTERPSQRATDAPAKVTEKPSTSSASREPDEAPTSTTTRPALETASLVVTATLEDAEDVPSEERASGLPSPTPRSTSTPMSTTVAATIEMTAAASSAKASPTLSATEIAEADQISEPSATKTADAVVAATAIATGSEAVTEPTLTPTESAATKQPTSPATDVTETSESVADVQTPTERPFQTEPQTVTATLTESARQTEEVSFTSTMTVTVPAVPAATEVAESVTSTQGESSGDKLEELTRAVKVTDTLTHTAEPATSAQNQLLTEATATATLRAAGTRTAPADGRMTATDAATTALPAVFAHLIATPTAYGAADGGVEGVCTVAAGWYPYKVQEGDTLLALAMASGSSLIDLRDGNCYSPVTGIFVGETVVVAQLPEAPLTAPEPIFTLAEEAIEVVGCDTGHARILLPEPMAELEGIFAVYGSALIPAGGTYRIAVRPAWSDEFHTFLEVDMSVVDNVIGLINSEIFGPGLQWLQLTLLGSEGRVVEGSLCEIPVVFTRPGN